MALLERRRFTVGFAIYYTSLCSRQANLDLFWIYLIVTSTKILENSSSNVSSGDVCFFV